MRKSWAITTILIIASLLFAACPAPAAPTGSTGAAAPTSADAASSGTGGTLIVGRGGDSVGLDAGTQTDGESARVINTIVDGLVALEGTSTKPIPWLAESWETTDSQTWIFHLRQGVKFHDGTPFNAEAVKWNMDRWRDPQNEWRFGRAFEYYDIEFGKDLAIEEVTAVDENTVQLKLSAPSGVLLAKLAEWWHEQPNRGAGAG